VNAATLELDAASQTRTPTIVLLGNPNTGKTTLFNRLCGLRAKTSNFPGTTTSTRTGRSGLGGAGRVDIVDLPGLYTLALDAPESRIVRTVLDGAARVRPDAVVLVVDACNLGRNLSLAAEVLASPVPVVVALNMVDLARQRGLHIDLAALSRRLGVAVVPIVASRGEGLDDLRAAVRDTLAGRERARPDPATQAVSLDDRSQWAESVAAAVVARTPRARVDTVTERLDRTFTHPIAGVAAFVVTMGGLFWTLFALAAVPMDAIEAVFAILGGLVGTYVPAGPFRDLLADGVIGGIAGTVVFLPQICLLFFLITLLEDSGYLARAAFVTDRVLSRFGLPGQAFVPLLTAHACAIPGIMSTRLIADSRDRLATILIAPFMSCSARLPVYVLLTSLLFGDRPALAGLAFAGCYVLGGGAALLTALVARRTVLKGHARPLILELPTYKRPSLTNALLTAKDQGLAFLRTVGTTIVAICIVMWWLSAYPRTEPSSDVLTLRAAATAAGAASDRAADLMAEADGLEAREAQAASYAGRIGRALQPVFAPLGYDWQLTVGVLTSFLAREVFVSTLSVLSGGGDEADADEGVISRIRSMKRADGSMVFTPATAASALIFFVLAMQCLPTLAVTRRETGSWRYAGIQLAYMSALAYVAAFVTYQSLRAAGIA
jgi:ferrous iron transport protein B